MPATYDTNRIHPSENNRKKDLSSIKHIEVSSVTQSKHPAETEDKENPFDSSKEDYPFWSSESREFLQNVSVSGLGYVADNSAPRPRRIWWLLLIVLGVTVTAYQITIQVTFYYEYPVRVSIKEKFVRSVPFPAVTVCSESRFSRRRVREYGRGLEPLLDALNPPFGTPAQLSANMSTAAQYNISGMSSDWRETYKNISFSSKQALAFCFFRGYLICQPEWISTEDDNTDRCFTFNRDGQLSQLVEGGLSGLSLLLFTNHSDSLALYDFTDGFRMILHEPKTTPFVWGGFKISPGFLTVAKLQKKEINLLPPPHEDCKERKLQYFDKYTQTNCIVECLSNKVQKRCGCILIGEPGPASAHVCDPVQETLCARIIVWTFDNNTAHECDCPIECKATVYQETLSMANFATALVDHMTNVPVAGYKMTEEQFRQNAAVIVLYYPKMSYKSVTSERAYSCNSLFCDMGGALGLLLGSTFFTLYEFIDFCFWAFYKRNFETS